jgi:hypothetical protein
MKKIEEKIKIIKEEMSKKKLEIFNSLGAVSLFVLWLVYASNLSNDSIVFFTILFFSFIVSIISGKGNKSSFETFLYLELILVFIFLYFSDTFFVFIETRYLILFLLFFITEILFIIEKVNIKKKKKGKLFDFVWNKKVKKLEISVLITSFLMQLCCVIDFIVEMIIIIKEFIFLEQISFISLFLNLLIVVIIFIFLGFLYYFLCYFLWWLFIKLNSLKYKKFVDKNPINKSNIK